MLLLSVAAVAKGLHHQLSLLKVFTTSVAVNLCHVIDFVTTTVSGILPVIKTFEFMDSVTGL